MELNSIRLAQGAGGTQPGTPRSAANQETTELREAQVQDRSTLPDGGVQSHQAVSSAAQGELSRDSTGSEDDGARNDMKTANGLQISVRMDEGNPVVQLVDPKTRQVVSEVPPEQLRNLGEAFDEHSLFLDREV